MALSNEHRDEFNRLIENELWGLYKFFPGDVIDSLDNLACAKYVSDIIKNKRSSGSGSQSQSLHTDLAEYLTINNIAERINTLRTYRNQLQALIDLPQVKQRSPEWFDIRKERLTASATAQAIGKGKFGNRNQLLQSKAFPENDKWLPNTSGPMYHGTMLEEMTARCYSQRNNDIRLHEFGMIKHPDLFCYGASPDGITELGIMIEIKTPWKRKVDGNIPEEYMLQMQGQMAACGLYECEFVDCKIDVLPNEYTYLQETRGLKDGRIDHGIIIEHRDERGNPQFQYSPEYYTAAETITWRNTYQANMSAAKDTRFTKITYWKMYKLIATRVYFDEKLWGDLVPQIKQFWEDVLQLRSHGPSEKKPTVKKEDKKRGQTFDFIDSDED
jgi:putative phage-type endonuclease